MECIDHRDAVGLSLDELDRRGVAIVAEFEEGFLGELIVFCYVSVPDRAVECVEKETGWKKIGFNSNTFLANGFMSEVGKVLKKVQLPD